MVFYIMRLLIEAQRTLFLEGITGFFF